MTAEIFRSSDYLLKSSTEFSIYVCTTRAIPHAGDGLKHVQRMVLWLMRNRAEKIKTVALSGLLAYEKLHVHGEQSANEAIGLLAAPFKNNIPLIEGEGQFGSRTQPDKEGIGAARYTEVKRAKASEIMLYHDLDIVPLVDNYDGSYKQPLYFLPLIPLVLLNGVSGVAVGYSTDILPHSLKSIVDATKAAVKGKPITPLVPKYDKYDITITSTGTLNQWVFSGKVEIIDTSTFRILEIPPGFKFKSDPPKEKEKETKKKRIPAGFINKLNDMEDRDLIQGYTDRSTDHIDIVVRMKRGSIAGWTPENAIDFLKLREKTTERIVVLDWSGERIRSYNTPEDLVLDFAQWRLGWYGVRYDKMISDTAYELPYWLALQTLFAKSFPTLLGSFVNKASMMEEVMKTLDYQEDTPHIIDEAQLNKIVNIATYYWTKEFSSTVDLKAAELTKNLADYIEIRADPDKLRDIYVSELDQLAKAMKV
jgi:hypothetical protein